MLQVVFLRYANVVLVWTIVEHINLLCDGINVMSLGFGAMK